MAFTQIYFLDMCLPHVNVFISLFKTVFVAYVIEIKKKTIATDNTVKPMNPLETIPQLICMPST